MTLEQWLPWHGVPWLILVSVIAVAAGIGWLARRRSHRRPER